MMKNYCATILALLSLLLFTPMLSLASEKKFSVEAVTSKEPVTLRGTIRPDGRTGKFIVTVRFDMDNDWYTYKDAGEGAGQPTTLTLKLPEGAKSEGEWSSSSEGIDGDEAYSKLYIGRVDFTKTVLLEPSAYGKKIEVIASYQACNSEYCNRPTTKIISIAIPGTDTNTAELFEKPVRLKVGDDFLNTAAKERFPSPAILDIDGDGQTELVIGSLSGRLGIYENLNTSGTGDPIWGPRKLLKDASGKAIRTRNWCCVGASAQLVDINGDGRKDILVGSFSGVPQWLMNTKDGYGESTHVRDKNGDLVTLTQFWDDDTEAWSPGQNGGVICSSVAAVDWDDDGDMDLLLGGYSGEVLELRLNEGSKDGAVQFATTNQPVLVGGKPFSLMSGGKGIGTPRIADWDGDGRFDILIGTIYGEVFLLRNTGSKGSPEFSEVTTLVEPYLGRAGSKKIKRVPSKNGSPVGPGSSFHIETVDYDGDGDLDLLVGARSEWLIEGAKTGSETLDQTKRGDFVWLYRRK
ncbi:VCBS repeat-containing protein [Flavobacteriaceae bacterium F08102]|nr:VCBS repeat-containing protein [Flavobacteriaceae bacterium F08102]